MSCATILIEKSVDGGATWSLAGSANPGETTIPVSGIVNNQSTQFRVRGQVGGNYSGYSEIVTLSCVWPWCGTESPWCGVGSPWVYGNSAWDNTNPPWQGGGVSWNCVSTNPGIISCTGACDETVKSTTKQYTYTPCVCEGGTVIWAVSGTGASISQSGLLTTTASACGTLTITATKPGCAVATQQVRVTDGGTWTDWTLTYSCTTCGGYCSPGHVCYSTTGNMQTEYTYWYIYPVHCGGAECSTCSNAVPPCRVPGEVCDQGAGCIQVSQIRTRTWVCP